MEKGFAHLLVLLGLLVILTIATVVYTQKNELIYLKIFPSKVTEVESVEATAQEPTPTPTPLPLWKTYTNSKYSFQLTYPKEGMLWAEEAYQLGECGGVIKEGAKQTNRILTSYVQEVIAVDSFFEILALKGPNSIDEYIADIGGKGQYDLFSFEGTGADEAVEVVGLKKGAEYAVGYPPLTYISHIFRKGENLFLIKHFFNPSNLGGCVDPALLDPVAHSHLKIKDWDLKGSFKFI